MCVIAQTAEKPCGVFVVCTCHDSWKLPESQMTVDKAQHESGKHRRRQRQIGREADRRDRKAGNESSKGRFNFINPCGTLGCSSMTPQKKIRRKYKSIKAFSEGFPVPLYCQNIFVGLRGMYIT